MTWKPNADNARRNREAWIRKQRVARVALGSGQSDEQLRAEVAKKMLEVAELGVVEFSDAVEYLRVAGYPEFADELERVGEDDWRRTIEETTPTKTIWPSGYVEDDGRLDELAEVCLECLGYGFVGEPDLDVDESSKTCPKCMGTGLMEKPMTWPPEVRG